MVQPSAWSDVPEGEFDAGEVPGADRVWVDGTPPYPVVGDGAVCGTALDFSGLAPPPADPPDLNQFGGLACCHLPDSPFLFFTCDSCPDGAYDVYTVIAEGFAPPNDGLNGAWVVRYQGGCAWESDPIPQPDDPAFSAEYRIEAFGPGINPSAAVTVDGWTHPLSGQIWRQIGGWDCLSGGRLPNTAPHAGVPATVQVIPGVITLGPDLRQCPSLAPNTSPVYYLRIPLVANPPGFFRISADTFALFQSDRCQWRGEVTVRRRAVLSPPLAVPVVMDVIPSDGSIILTFEPDLFSIAQGRFTYQSAPAWPGNVDIACMQLNIPLTSFITWPLSVTVAVPVLP